MLYKRLNNGVEIPMVGFGTYKIQGEECTNCVLHALECGYRMIDTAQAYGNEDAVGKAVRYAGIPREDLFITTKVNFRSFEDAGSIVLKSLEHLCAEYLDLVLLHWPFGNYYKAWRTLESLYEQGVVRAIGISNFSADRMIDLIGFNKVVPALNQVETHLFCQRKSEHGWMQKYGVAHQAYAPLGQGRKSEMFTNETVVKIADALGKTPAQVALRFLLQKDIIVIPKSAHKKRIRENFALFDFFLDETQMQALCSLDTAEAMIGNPEKPERTENAMKNWW